MTMGYVYYAFLLQLSVPAAEEAFSHAATLGIKPHSSMFTPHVVYLKILCVSCILNFDFLLLDGYNLAYPQTCYYVFLCHNRYFAPMVELVYTAG